MICGSIVTLSLCAFSLPLASRSESFVGFDTAIASSVYSTGFSADQALTAGTGYWLSSGSHGAGQSVTWTGVLNVRRKVAGVQLNWAYAPGEYKVLVSSDGGNFEEAACWRSSSRSEVSYKEMVLFKDVRTAKALAIVMKAPMPWSYFGLNDVSLLTEGDEAFMIVRSGASSHGLEECLVASGHEISAQACLDAIASGDGREVFKFQGADLMHSASGLCVAYAPGASNQVALQNCGVAARAQDGRASWGLTAEGQMKLTRMGNYCLNVVAGRASADDCGSSSEKFVLAVVPEFDLSAAGIAQDQATLLAAATKRQRRALNALQLQIPSLGGCKFAVSSFASQTNVTKLTFTHSVGLDLHAMQKSNGRGETAVAAVGRIYSAMGVDMADVVQLIGDSSKALEAVEAKLMHSA